MNREISDRILSTINHQGKSKAMLVSVDAFGPKEADLFARKMIEAESRGSGDQMNAMERVASRCGLTARQLRRFLQGEIKSPGWGLVNGILAGWISLWDEKIRVMQAEVKAVRERCKGDRREDLMAEVAALDSEIEALAARVRRAKGR
ncbi:hypothetical protein [Rhizobium phaseoli]|uniref:Uncharacterized protein n=1 Tax=Rhizobium phaseoli TaxID=396 RepID=A0ABM6C8V0_9HYPH|nr:hypothetical protein [Rhizobium phaseoli]ANL84638.1 hypothetical protein AMC81_CH01857 [Rhizobium phaseoli]ANL91145.1 hypothetical protein AMC80_CH01857 [Rhizobium phaseoli]